MLPFIVVGLTAGAVYALAAIGLVLTYKTSGVFNFAHGAIATVGAYAFYALFVLGDWPWLLAAAVATLVVGPLVGVLMELLARRIGRRSLALQVGATVGLLLVIDGAVRLIYDTDTPRNVPVFLGTGSVDLLGTPVQLSQIVTFLVAVVATVVLTGFFRFSRRGTAMRAVVDDPELLDLTGTAPIATRRLAWVIGATLAAASGVLFAPLLPLDPLQLTMLVVAAFGAAAVGAFRSLPLTLVGGLLIGVVASIGTKWFTDGLLAGLPASMPFVVLFVVLLVFPRRYLASVTTIASGHRAAWSAPPALQITAAVALVALLAVVPSFVGVRLTDWSTFVAMTIVFLSLSLLVRTSGQVSLAHVSFLAIGAAGFSQLAVAAGLPWLVALLGAGLIAVPIGALLAIPAVRLGGLYLALATFGFGVLLQGMLYTQEFMFGASNAGIPAPRPSLGFLDVSSDAGYHRLLLAIAVVVAILVVVLTRSRLGRLLRASADSPTALQSVGTSVRVSRVLVFCLSAFLAALGGALAAVAAGTVSADGYQPLLSLTFFALVMIVGRSTPWSAVLAAAGLYLVPSYVTGGDTAVVLQLGFGALAIAYACAPDGRRGVPLGVQRLVDRWSGPLRRTGGRPPEAAGLADDDRRPGGLSVEGLTVRFGGIVAVNGVSLEAPPGRITGLIGPNGAGKTTTFGACSGLLRPAAGVVRIGGDDASGRPPDALARRGLGRTFQRMQLLESLSVRENVELGAEGVLAGANPLTHLLGRPGQRARVRSRAAAAIELCGLGELADAPAGALSTGHRRLVELARCLAGPFGQLLLDEPSSGLDREETRHFGRVLRHVAAEHGVGILLVEHDMSLVLDICDHLYVLDFGELIASGTPEQIMASPIVRAAYLGDDEVEAAVSPRQEEGDRVADAR